MCAIEKILSKLYVVTDSFTGNKVFKEIADEGQQTDIKVVTLENYTLDIKVVRKNYVLERPGWWFFKKKRYVIYEVSCLTPGMFPVNVARVFKHPVYLPRLLMKFVSEEKQINAVISAYIDVKTKELKQKKES